MKSNNQFLLENLRFSYDGARDHVAIDRLTFEKEGITLFYGDNGSGKTTLLKLIAGLLPPGTQNPKEKISPDLRELRQKSVYLHQNPYLLRGSILKNLRLATASRNSEGRERINEALRLVGLENREDENVRALSGGERKRVAIARALLTDMKVMLFDEPAAHLDAEARLLLEKIFTRLSGEGRTLLVATHIQEFGYRISSQIRLLDKGRLMEEEANIYRGKFLRGPNTTHFETGGTTIVVPDIEGDFRTAVLDFDDIILTKTEPRTSARNLLTGTVRSIQPSERGILVTVDCGIPVKTHITRSSLQELALEEGSDIMVLFKASSVRLY